MRGMQAQGSNPWVDDAFFKEAHNKIKVNKRERTKWSDMITRSSSKILTHLRAMNSHFVALVQEDKKGADIWELASALASEREFILTQLLERERTFQSRKSDKPEKEKSKVFPLARSDRDVVLLFVTWARAQARIIKAPSSSSLETLKAAIYKDTILHAALVNIMSDIEELRNTLNLPHMKSGLGGTLTENLQKSHAKEQAKMLVDLYKADGSQGRAAVERAKEAGPKVNQQFSDMLNEEGICRNCITAGRPFSIAKTHKVKERRTLGYMCVLQCTKCKSKAPHWEWECPAVRPNPKKNPKKKPTAEVTRKEENNRDADRKDRRPKSRRGNRHGKRR